MPGAGQPGFMPEPRLPLSLVALPLHFRLWTRDLWGGGCWDLMTERGKQQNIEVSSDTQPDPRQGLSRHRQIYSEIHREKRERQHREG